MTDPTWKRAVDKTLGRDDRSRMRDTLPPWRNAWRTACFCTSLFVGYLIGWNLMAAIFPR